MTSAYLQTLHHPCGVLSDKEFGRLGQLVLLSRLIGQLWHEIQLGGSNGTRKSSKSRLVVFYRGKVSSVLIAKLERKKDGRAYPSSIAIGKRQASTGNCPRIIFWPISRPLPQEPLYNLPKHLICIPTVRGRAWPAPPLQPEGA